MEGSDSKEAETETEGSGSAGGNRKTKMDKTYIDIFLKDRPHAMPLTYATPNPIINSMFDRKIALYEVDCEFREYLRRQSIIRGYAEVQREVADDEDE